MKILEEIMLWFKDRPIWQRDALRRLVIDGELEENDIDDPVHACHIVTNTRWKISLNRDLDIFQPGDIIDALTFMNRLQQYRPFKLFEVTYMWIR